MISIIWCIVRCACCGLSCCCTCFSCLKCCGDCCGCCTKPGDRKQKYLDEPQAPPPLAAPINQGYQAPQTMGYTTAAEPVKFATFETGKSGFAVDPPKSAMNDDALPPMPSWEGAQRKRIMDEEEAMHAKEEGMELGQLNHQGQNLPLMNGQSPAITPMDGHPGMAQGGYMAGGHSPVDQYGRSVTGGNSPIDQYDRGFGGPQGPPGRGQPFNNGYGQSPQGQYPPDGGFAGAGRGPPGAPGGYRGVGGPGGPIRPPGRQLTGSPANGFGPPARQMTGSPANGYGPPGRQMNNSPGPNGFGPPQRSLTGGSDRNFGPPQRSMTGGSMNNGQGRGYGTQPGPQRSYTRDSYRGGPGGMLPTSPSSPLNSDPGNFSYPPEGYSSPPPNFSRPSPPQQQGSFNSIPPSYVSRIASPPPSINPPGGYRGVSPAPPTIIRRPSPAQYQAMPASMSNMSTEERRASGGVAYPGYKPYSPAPQAPVQEEGIPSALMPGGRG